MFKSTNLIYVLINLFDLYLDIDLELNICSEKSWVICLSSTWSFPLIFDFNKMVTKSMKLFTVFKNVWIWNNFFLHVYKRDTEALGINNLVLTHTHKGRGRHDLLPTSKAPPMSAADGKVCADLFTAVCGRLGGALP